MTTSQIVCPKCRYERQPADQGPEHECPRCGVIYAKAFPRPRPTAPAKRARPATSIIWGIALLFLAGIAYLALQRVAALQEAVESKPAPDTDALARAKAREERELRKEQERARLKSEVDKAAAALAQNHRKWVDTSELASSTSRLSLSGPVATLQSILRDSEAVLVPPCLSDAKTKLLTGMRLDIDGYLTFMRDANNKFTTLILSTKAATAFDEYKALSTTCPDPEATTSN